MRRQKAFITELIKSITKIKPMAVLAEEPQTGTEPEPTTTVPTVNYEDLIANARKQEKDKLYPQIKKLEEEKNVLTTKLNNNLLSLGEKDSLITELKKKLEEANNNSGASERETSLLAEIDTLKQTIANMEASTVTREELEAEIKAEYEVKLYREQKLREIGDTAIPELITGSTGEEIDASIKVSQERYQQITNKLIGTMTNNVPVANTNLSSVHTKDLKIEDIANLDPRSPEYAQLRAKLGLR